MINDSWSIKNFIKAVFPVATGKYWYITSYMMLMIFSEYINLIPEKMEKKKYEKLIFLMLLVLSIIPTIIQIHVMNDGGKGFANMMLMYLIGRYIRFYYDNEYNCKVSVAVGAFVVLIGFVFNLILTMRRGEGVCAPFARDCSIVIVVASICIFLIFKRLKFYSKFVNSLAKHVVGIYLFEGAMRTILGNFFDITYTVKSGICL